MVVTKPLPPQHRVVTEVELARALDWLRDNADDLGKAKGRLVKAEYYVKHVEALVMRSSDARSAEMRKADARVDQRWIEATDEEAIAAGEYEKLKALREAAALKIEAWRTEQANYRSMKI
jgi:hypothetical protein